MAAPVVLPDIKGCMNYVKLWEYHVLIRLKIREVHDAMACTGVTSRNANSPRVVPRCRCGDAPSNPLHIHVPNVRNVIGMFPGCVCNSVDIVI
jgi:hypothetical protein